METAKDLVASVEEMKVIQLRLNLYFLNTIVELLSSSKAVVSKKFLLCRLPNKKQT